MSRVKIFTQNQQKKEITHYINFGPVHDNIKVSTTNCPLLSTGSVNPLTGLCIADSRYPAVAGSISKEWRRKSKGGLINKKKLRHANSVKDSPRIMSKLLGRTAAAKSFRCPAASSAIPLARRWLDYNALSPVYIQPLSDTSQRHFTISYTIPGPGSDIETEIYSSAKAFQDTFHRLYSWSCRST